MYVNVGELYKHIEAWWDEHGCPPRELKKQNMWKTIAIFAIQHPHDFELMVDRVKSPVAKGYKV